MTGIKRLVLDVQKPINMPLNILATELANVHGVEGVDVHIQEVEQKVESARITMEGENIDFEKARGVIETLGASIKSVDRITCGKRIVG